MISFLKIKRIFINKAKQNRRVMAKFAQFVNVDNKPVYINLSNVDSFGPETFGDGIVIAVHTKSGHTERRITKCC